MREGPQGELELWIEFEHLPKEGGKLTVMPAGGGHIRLTILSEDTEHAFETIAVLSRAQALMVASVLKTMTVDGAYLE